MPQRKRKSSVEICDEYHTALNEHIQEWARKLKAAEEIQDAEEGARCRHQVDKFQASLDAYLSEQSERSAKRRHSLTASSIASDILASRQVKRKPTKPFDVFFRMVSKAIEDPIDPTVITQVRIFSAVSYSLFVFVLQFPARYFNVELFSVFLSL